MPAKKNFIRSICCMFCLLFPAFPFAATAEMPHYKISNSIGLCEIHVADIKMSLYSGFYSILEDIVKSRCLLLTHPAAKRSDAGDTNFFSTEQKTDQAFPIIVVDGKDKLSASPSTSWQTDLSRVLDKNMTCEKWKIGLYLSSRLSQEGKPVFDFSICNMEKIKKLNGSFTLWIAEMITLESGQNVWVTTKKLAENSIRQLPPAKTIGCSLPDRFSLPQLSGGKKYCIISVVYASDSSVQAVGQEFLSL